MLQSIIPKLPMRSKTSTKDFYVNQLGFTDIGSADFEGYLIVQKEDIEIHFFEHSTIDPKENYGQVYIRTQAIETLYELLLAKNLIHPTGHLQNKPWRQKEFSILDPDNNLLTFGEPIS